MTALSPVPRKPDPSLVAHLTALLEAAREGNLHALVGVYEIEGVEYCAFGVDDDEEKMRFASALRKLARRMEDATDE